MSVETSAVSSIVGIWLLCVPGAIVVVAVAGVVVVVHTPVVAAVVAPVVSLAGGHIPPGHLRVSPLGLAELESGTV